MDIGGILSRAGAAARGFDQAQQRRLQLDAEIFRQEQAEQERARLEQLREAARGYSPQFGLANYQFGGDQVGLVGPTAAPTAPPAPPAPAPTAPPEPEVQLSPRALEILASAERAPEAPWVTNLFNEYVETRRQLETQRRRTSLTPRLQNRIREIERTMPEFIQRYDEETQLGEGLGGRSFAPPIDPNNLVLGAPAPATAAPAAPAPATAASATATAAPAPAPAPAGLALEPEDPATAPPDQPATITLTNMQTRGNLPREAQRIADRYEQLTRLFDAYREAGEFQGMLAIEAQLEALELRYDMAVGLAALSDLERGDPRLANNFFSQWGGTNFQLTPVGADDEWSGEYNVMINGVPQEAGVPVDNLITYLRTQFDGQFLEQQRAAAAQQAEYAALLQRAVAPALIGAESRITVAQLQRAQDQGRVEYQNDDANGNPIYEIDGQMFVAVPAMRQVPSGRLGPFGGPIMEDEDYLELRPVEGLPPS